MLPQQQLLRSCYVMLRKLIWMLACYEAMCCMTSRLEKQSYRLLLGTTNVAFNKEHGIVCGIDLHCPACQCRPCHFELWYLQVGVHLPCAWSWMPSNTKLEHNNASADSCDFPMLLLTELNKMLLLVAERRTEPSCSDWLLISMHRSCGSSH